MCGETLGSRRIGLGGTIGLMLQFAFVLVLVLGSCGQTGPSEGAATKEEAPTSEHYYDESDAEGFDGALPNCPTGAVARVVARRNMSTDRPGHSLEFSQFETYCEANGLLQGPYVVWGPNGEQSITGSYEKGKKSGKWTFQIPSQRHESEWVDGKRQTIAVLPRQARWKLDVARCNEQRYGWELARHSIGYEVVGRTDELCEVETWWTAQLQRRRRVTTCRFPRSLIGVPWVQFGGSIKFDGQERYCDYVGKPPASALR